MDEFVIYDGAKAAAVIIDKEAPPQLRRAAGEWGDFCERHKNDYNWKDDCSFDYTQNKEAILGYWTRPTRILKAFSLSASGAFTTATPKQTTSAPTAVVRST